MAMIECKHGNQYECPECDAEQGKLGELTVTFASSVAENNLRNARRLFVLSMKDEVGTEWPFHIVADAAAKVPREGQKVRAVFYAVEDR